ncbi:MAG: ROK family protein [Clostridiales bacterium]|nr:ROK family protein [Clostridiales bacterium]
MNHRGDNMSTVKRYNRSVILRLLHEHGGLSRKRMAEEMSLTPAAITMIVSEMIGEGLLFEGATLESNGSAGRKEIMVNINLTGFVALGVSINLQEVLLSATTLDGALLFSESIPCRADLPVSEALNIMETRLPALIADHGIALESIVGLGLAVRGTVDENRSKSLNSFGALEGENIPLAQLVAERTGFHTTMDNNVRSMFRAHMFFSTEQASSLFFIRCEKGIGGAVSADHRILTGSSGMCSEFGHMPIVELGGKRCHCGKTGCLETVASPMAICEDVGSIFSAERTPRLYALTGGHQNRVNLPLIMEAAQTGDLPVDAIVQNAASKLSSAIKAIVYTLDPARVVLYGSIFNLPYYYESLQAHLRIGFDRGDGGDYAQKSRFNLQLEEKAACVTAIDAFYKNGGYLTWEK